MKTCVSVIILNAVVFGTAWGQLAFPQDDPQSRTFIEPCVMDTDEDGLCVPITKCSPLANELNLRRLIKLKCGFMGMEPKICCPDDHPVTTEKPVTRASVTETTTYKKFDDGYVISEKENCGKASVDSRLISRCESAKPDSWPWMAVLFANSKSKGVRPRCGATLISDNVVLTAAYCVMNRKPAQLFVRLGEYDMDIDSTKDGAKDYRVKMIAVHPGFKTSDLINDIAVLKLTEKVKLQDNIYPVCLVPKTVQLPEHSSAYLPGWGHNPYGKPTSTVLRQSINAIMSSEQCRKQFDRITGNFTDSFFCSSGSPSPPHVNPCEGDFGGPLLVVDSSNKWYIAGMVAYQGGYFKRGFPSLYTKISDHLDFIRSHM